MTGYETMSRRVQLKLVCKLFKYTWQMKNKPSSNILWQPPQIGLVKCNVDAGFHDRGRIVKRGWCIRDAMGLFVRAGTAWDT
jgi:hypothetical protein